ncbi:MAG: hypothetical protein ACR2L1_02855 [Pyrinomonadaceae bacterium]
MYVLKNSSPENILNRKLDDGFNLLDLLGEVVDHYLNRALSEVIQSRSKAAKFVELANYQTLDNWLKKHPRV